MRVAVHSAVKKLIEAEAREVVLPGEDGELSVLDFHQNCFYSLRAGQVKLALAGPDKNAEQRFLLKKGLAVIGSGRVLILIED